MPIELMITREDDPGFQVRREFGQEVVTIGRSNANTLLLEDPQKLVSRQHATLEWRNDTCFITDNGSRNSTYVNDLQLRANEPHPLTEGDIVRIGEFRLNCLRIVGEQPADATVMLVNPFEEDLKILANALKKLSRTFENSDPDSREVQLRRGLDNYIGTVELPGIIGTVLADVLASPTPDVPDDSPSRNPSAPKADKDDPHYKPGITHNIDFNDDFQDLD